MICAENQKETDFLINSNKQHEIYTVLGTGFYFYLDTFIYCASDNFILL